MSILYAGIYPEDVDLLIGLDNLQLPEKSPETLIKYLHANSENNLKSINIIVDGLEQPNYTYDEMIDRLTIGGSITRETAPFLLERGSIKSETHPNRYTFTHDIRAKSGAVRINNNEVFQEIARRIKCPVLFFKASILQPEAAYHDDIKAFEKVTDVFRENNPSFEFYVAEGAHHFHLTNVEGIANIMANFINKYRPLAN